MTILSFPRFSPMISALVFSLIPGTLAPSVANHRFLRWMSRLTSDPLGRLFAVVLVSHHPFLAYMFRSTFVLASVRFQSMCRFFLCCCFSPSFMHLRSDSSVTFDELVLPRLR